MILPATVTSSSVCSSSLSISQSLGLLISSVVFLRLTPPFILSPAMPIIPVIFDTSVSMSPFAVFTPSFIHVIGTIMPITLLF